MHRFSDEGGLVVRHDETDDDFEGKPRVADALDEEERLMRLSPLFLHPPAGRSWGPRLVAGRRQVAGVVVDDVEGDVAQDGDSHAVVRLEAERKNRGDDEEDGDAWDHLHHHSIDQSTTLLHINKARSGSCEWEK